MSCCLNSDFSVFTKNRNSQLFRICSSIGPSPQLKESYSEEFLGKQKGVSINVKAPAFNPVNAKSSSSICIGKSLKWWEKSVEENMIEIHSAQHFVDSLLNAGEKLVIVDFYAPGCGGCKSLHPKICQLAEMNPNALFLKVNYDEHKAMCYALRVHVLPFFRFYRGAEGKVCSFSCTNATIKKFKGALDKYGTERCSLGPVKGLDESEIMALSSIGLLTIPNLSMDNDLGNLVLNGMSKEGNAMAMA